MSYFLAPSLVSLRDQINARWPNRDKGSDGWIGDPSHQARPSDHNPDYGDGGIVRAIDVDKDGISVTELLKAVIGHARVAYVIWNWRIWTHKDGWQPYAGPNGHTAHVHISIRHTSAAAASGSWALGGTVAPSKAPAKTPTPAAPSKAWPNAKLKVTDSHTLASDQAWRKLMADVGYRDKSLTTNMQRWLKKLGYYKGWIEADRGQKPAFGPMLIEALQAFLVDKKLLPSKAYIDSKREAKTIRAEIGYLNQQAKHY